MNTVISYPRTGINWLQDRLFLFYYKCIDQNIVRRDILDKVEMTHAAYGPGASSTPVMTIEKYLNSKYIFVCLRDVKAIMSSYFYLMTTIKINLLILIFL